MFERCLYFNVNALARKVNAIWEEAFAEFGLSPAHAYLLRLVLENEGMSQGQIATELKLEKSTITRFVTTLEQRELLTRERRGREVLVYATQQAINIHEKLEAKGEELYRKMQASLGESEMREFVSQLRLSGEKIPGGR